MADSDILHAFFIHVASRKIHVAGVTPHPDQRWMMPITRGLLKYYDREAA